MTKAMEMKKVRMETMANVTGGTVKEFEEIVTALAPTGLLKTAGKISAHIPIGNQKSAEIVTGILQKKGIGAHIDLGWQGTGIGSDHNTYVNMNTGLPMSHQEVLDVVKSFKVG